MNQESIGKFIQVKRKERNLTQSELGEKLGVSYKAVSKWECGRAMPDVSLFKSLCLELGISINELLNGASDDNIKDDDGVVEYISHQKKKYKLKMIVAIIIMVLLFTTFIFFTYFHNNYNKFKVYNLSGESEHFIYSDGLFLDSNIEYYLVNGILSRKTDDAPLLENIIYVNYKLDGKTFVGSGGIPHGYIQEHYGYEDIFSKHVVENIGFWYLEIGYLENDEYKTELIELKNTNSIKNTKFFEEKVETISSSQESAEDEYNERLKVIIKETEERIAKLETLGFKKAQKAKYTPMGGSEYFEKMRELDSFYYYKKYEDNSSLHIEPAYAGYVTYITKDYLFSKSLGSKYFSFNILDSYGSNIGGYTYNRENDSGTCGNGLCNEDFVETARKAAEFYEKELDGIYYYIENERPLDGDKE